MELLKQLTPAECLLLLEKKEAELKKYLKFTFMDLLLKQVLKTKTVKKQANKRDPVREHLYVIAGDNFDDYIPLPHELFFLYLFKRKKAIQVLFANLVALAYQRSGAKKKEVDKLLLKTPGLKPLFQWRLITTLSGFLILSTKGKAAQRELKVSIRKLEIVTSAALNDKEAQDKLKEAFKTINGNVFLLRNFEIGLLKKLDIELQNEIDRNKRYQLELDMDWEIFDSLFNSFDLSFDSIDLDIGVDGVLDAVDFG